MDLRANTVGGLTGDDYAVQFRCHFHEQCRFANNARIGSRYGTISSWLDNLAVSTKPSQARNRIAAVRFASDCDRLTRTEFLRSDFYRQMFWCNCKSKQNVLLAFS